MEKTIMSSPANTTGPLSMQTSPYSPLPSAGRKLPLLTRPTYIPPQTAPSSRGAALRSSQEKAEEKLPSREEKEELPSPREEKKATPLPEEQEEVPFEEEKEEILPEEKLSSGEKEIIEVCPTPALSGIILSRNVEQLDTYLKSEAEKVVQALNLAVQTNNVDMFSTLLSVYRPEMFPQRFSLPSRIPTAFHELMRNIAFMRAKKLNPLDIDPDEFV